MITAAIIVAVYSLDMSVKVFSVATSTRILFGFGHTSILHWLHCVLGFEEKGMKTNLAVEAGSWCM